MRRHVRRRKVAKQAYLCAQELWTSPRDHDYTLCGYFGENTLPHEDHTHMRERDVSLMPMHRRAYARIFHRVKVRYTRTLRERVWSREFLRSAIKCRFQRWPEDVECHSAGWAYITVPDLSMAGLPMDYHGILETLSVPLIREMVTKLFHSVEPEVWKLNDAEQVVELFLSLHPEWFRGVAP